MQVKEILDIFAKKEFLKENDLYFIGGTALSYYLNHRISEDIDFISSLPLNHRLIKKEMSSLNAKFIEDENASRLRIAGLFPDEWILKFFIDGVKIEFFQASTPLMKKIIKSSRIEYIGNIKILDIKTISKLKTIAFFQRGKSRDIFDVNEILKNSILTINETVDIAQNIHFAIIDKENLLNFIRNMSEPIEDETVYLKENSNEYLLFEDLKEMLIKTIKGLYKGK